MTWKTHSTHTACVAVLAVAVMSLVLAGCTDEQNSAPAPGAGGAKLNDSTSPASTVVVMKTTKGTIRIELNAAKAPLSVANFLRYVDERHFDGTIFHRVMPGFMIQAGGLDAKLNKKPTHDPIRNESANGLSNTVGTIAMARTGEPHSATDQFFINTSPNAERLDRSRRVGWGYAVFGKVTEGMDVANVIVNVPTHTVNGREYVPVDPVMILSVRRAD